MSQSYETDLPSMTDSRMTPSGVPNFAALGQSVPGHAQGWSNRHFSGRKAGGGADGHVRLEGDRLVAGGSILDSVAALRALSTSSTILDKGMGKRDRSNSSATSPKGIRRR